MKMRMDRFINLMETVHGEKNSEFLEKLWNYLNANDLELWDLISDFLHSIILNANDYGLTEGYQITDLEYLITEFKEIITDLNEKLKKLKINTL